MSTKINCDATLLEKALPLATLVWLIAAVFHLLAFPPRWEATGFAFQLLGAGVALWIVGRCVVLLFTTQSEHGNSWGAVFPIVIGELVLVLYFYGRSSLSRLSELLFHTPLPVSTAELGAIVFVAVCFLATKRFGVPRGEPAKGKVIIWCGWMALFFLACLIGAFRELPREIMPSSDPDQHLFFAKQITRFGVIPWQQGEWGPLDFGYPAGFATIVVVWASLSGLSLSAALAVQPFVQTSLAVLGIAALFSERLTRGRLQWVVGATVFLSFALLLPYTFEPNYFHLEVTGRISSLALVSLFLVAAFFKDESSWVIAVSTAMLLLFINPALIVVPACVMGIVCVLSLIRLGVFPWKRCASLGGLLLIAALVEPYYWERVTRMMSSPLSAEFLALGGSEPFKWETSEIFSDFLGALFFNAVPGLVNVFSIRYFNSTILSAGFLLFLGGAVWMLRQRIEPSLRFILLWGLSLIALMWLGILPFLQVLQGVGDLNLLYAYFHWTIEQCVLVWCFLAIAFIVREAILRGPYGCAAILVVSLLFYPILQKHRDESSTVQLRPRVSACGSPGCLTSHDRAALQFLERLKQEHLLGEDVEVQSTPRILIANAPAKVGSERRLFPTGGARVLPLYDTFPGAFFYFQGHPDFSYTNYQQRICQRLDLAWLHERGIRYLFLPEHREGTCVRTLTRLLKVSELLLFQSGEARVLALPPPSRDAERNVGLHDGEDHPSVRD